MKCAFLASQALLTVLMLSPTVSYNLVTSFAIKMPAEAVSDFRIVTLLIVFSRDAVIVLSLYKVSLQKVSDNTVMP